MITRRSAFALPALAAPAFAQNWPDRPIRLIVAFPAGTITDTLFRSLVEPLSTELGQPVVIDNRPGGNGVVGTMAARTAQPDGHTWIVLSVTNASLNTWTVRNLAYDPLNDFAHLGSVAEAPYLVVAPNNGATSITDLLDRARRRPGELTFSHANTSAQIASEMLNRAAGVRMTAVPYRGGPEALTDVIAGRIDSTFTDFANGLAQVREGRVRALGVTTPEPFPLAPEIPPISRTVPGFALTVWFGLGTVQPAPVAAVTRANAALQRVLRQPDVIARLGRMGYSPIPNSPEQNRDFLIQETRKWVETAQSLGIERQ
jgi:tripartite-type tricarboxylate transporter receptor subunit TctC